MTMSGQWPLSAVGRLGLSYSPPCAQGSGAAGRGVQVDVDAPQVGLVKVGAPLVITATVEVSPRRSARQPSGYGRVGPALAAGSGTAARGPAAGCRRRPGGAGRADAV